MVRAAARGLVDFREADPRSTRWWAKLRLVLDELERDALVQQHRLHYDYNLAILSRNELREAPARQFFKDAEKKLTQIAGLLRPWAAADPEAAQRAQAEAMSKAWDQTFGRHDDPAVQADIAETVRMLNKLDVGTRRARDGPTVLG
jgi:hypothetical protein